MKAGPGESKTLMRVLASCSLTMLVKRLSCFIVILVLFLPMAGVASAREIHVKDHYSGMDTIDEQNSYRISVGEGGGEIRFTVESYDSSFRLYFCEGHTSSSSNYSPKHSADEPSESFNASLRVGKNGNKHYSINIHNASGRPVTCHITISISSEDDPICWESCFFTLAGGCLVYLRLRKRPAGKALEKKINSWWYPPPPEIKSLPRQAPKARYTRYKQQQELPNLQEESSYDLANEPWKPPDQ